MPDTLLTLHELPHLIIVNIVMSWVPLSYPFKDKQVQGSYLICLNHTVLGVRFEPLFLYDYKVCALPQPGISLYQ